MKLEPKPAIQATLYLLLFVGVIMLVKFLPDRVFYGLLLSMYLAIM